MTPFYGARLSQKHWNKSIKLLDKYTQCIFVDHKNSMLFLTLKSNKPVFLSLFAIVLTIAFQKMGCNSSLYMESCPKTWRRVRYTWVDTVNKSNDIHSHEISAERGL